MFGYGFMALIAEDAKGGNSLESSSVIVLIWLILGTREAKKGTLPIASLRTVCSGARGAQRDDAGWPCRVIATLSRCLMPSKYSW